MQTPKSILAGLAIGLLLASLSAGRADEVDDVVAAQMRARHIPGLSLAIIANGKVARAQGYGFADEARKTPVTTETLFQAGSISKPVTAVGVLRLVDQQKLALDDNVNNKLQSWKVPENKFTAKEKVTIRRLLSHGAGLTVHGFPGYNVKSKLPTIVQVLDGAKPANTEAVRVEILPGTKWQYSGGGYTVLQQLIVDATGKSFPAFMQDEVLSPIGMKSSTFEQPLPADKQRLAATGYLPSGKAVAGGWHVYPEMAAAGLWTTASDLARFAIAIQQAYDGDPQGVLAPATAREMLKQQMGDFGLGVAILGDEGQKTLIGDKRTLIFCHGGRDEGFDANLAATATTGKGAVILINKNDDDQMAGIGEIMKVITKKYNWP